jgi:hypothetical protein
MANHQNRSIIVAIVCGVIGLTGGYVAYMTLGAASGIIAICGSAPLWLVKAFIAGVVVVPVFAVWVAVRGRRRYLKRHA